MLRIDETSKTLVAPQAGGLVTEGNPDRAELLALLAASWEAFSAELGHPSLRFVASQPVPGLDILAFDEQAGRPRGVRRRGDHGRRKHAAARRLASQAPEADDHRVVVGDLRGELAVDVDAVELGQGEQQDR